MIKNILLNYVMGKYRSFIVISVIVLTTLNAMRAHTVFNSEVLIVYKIAYLLAYVPFLFAIYNIPNIVSDAVDESSNGWDIFCRALYILGTLSLVFGSIYITFIPKLLLGD